MIRETNIEVQPGDTVNLLTRSGVQVGHWVFGKTARRISLVMMIWKWVMLFLFLILAVVMGLAITRSLSEIFTLKNSFGMGMSVAIVSYAVFYTAWMQYWKNFASSLYEIGGSFSWRQEASDNNPPPPAPPAPPTTDKDEKAVFGGGRR